MIEAPRRGGSQGGMTRGYRGDRLDSLTPFEQAVGVLERVIDVVRGFDRRSSLNRELPRARRQ